MANNFRPSIGKSGISSSNHNMDNLPILRDYNTIINDNLTPFVKLSRQIGGELTIMIDHLITLFHAQRDFLRYAIQHQKPTNDRQITELIKPQSNEIEAIVAFTNKNRKSTLFNHLSSISEGIPSFGWILMTSTPSSHIKEMLDASQFYTNRVLKEFKEKDSIHMEWVKQWIKMLNQLHDYVKQYHTNGLTWNGSNQNTSVTSSFSNLQIHSNTSSKTGYMDSISALGTNATSNLKKPSDDISKNLQFKQQQPNQSQISVSNATNGGTPKLCLEGNKWIVEYYSNRNDIKISETNMKQTIYIYKCTKSTIIIEGKVNSIVLDQCSKVGIQFLSVLSLLEFINCHSMKAQVIESVPTIQIEKTDGCHIYLSKKSLDTQFITSKSSEMTVNIPLNNGDYKEYPIPEQFKTFFQKGNQLVTVPNESAGV